MSKSTFIEEYRGFIIDRVEWYHPETGNIMYFRMKENGGNWKGHTIGSKTEVEYCHEFIDDLIAFHEKRLCVNAVGV